jgi:hypothetical protein
MPGEGGSAVPPRTSTPLPDRAGDPDAACGAGDAAGDRFAVDDVSDRHAPLGDAGYELPGPIQGIDDPDGRGREAVGVVGGLLG